MKMQLVLLYLLTLIGAGTFSFARTLPRDVTRDNHQATPCVVSNCITPEIGFELDIPRLLSERSQDLHEAPTGIDLGRTLITDDFTASLLRRGGAGRVGYEEVFYSSSEDDLTAEEAAKLMEAAAARRKGGGGDSDDDGTTSTEQQVAAWSQRNPDQAASYQNPIDMFSTLFVTAKNQFAESLGKDKALFWSRGGAIPPPITRDEKSYEEKAAQYATENGWVVSGALFPALREKVVPDWESLQLNQKGAFNEIASGAMANVASGDVHIMYSKGGLVSHDGAWSIAEWPEIRLPENKITSITWVDPDDFTNQKLLWERSGGFDGDLWPLNSIDSDIWPLRSTPVAD